MTSSQFDPYLFAQVERERAQARERHRQTTLNQVEEQVRRCMAPRPLVRVYLFGSLLRPGCFGRTSDIDVAIEGATSSEYLAVLGELEECLPTECLDLVELERCSFPELVRRTGRRLQ